jgi:hypothetical protein
MTARKKTVELIGDIEPQLIYRVTLSPAIFGYGQQRTNELIKNGELPVPFPLSATSTFKAWTGQQILDHRAAMQKQAEANVRGLRERPKQEQPKALQPKIKKLRLRKPARATS